MGDVTSPKCRDTVWITTRGGTVKSKFVDDWRAVDRWWYWHYYCKLPVGDYRIRVSCVDMAGNVADYHVGAWLKVR
jgi:hypothetical protein